MGCQDRGARLQLKAKKRHRKGANIIWDHSHVAHVAGVLMDGFADQGDKSSE